VFNRIVVPGCLERIATDHSNCRQRCIDILTVNLEQYETNNSGLNAFLILSLVKLKAVEVIDLIRASYAADCVEIGVLGDVEDAEIIMGVRQSRSTPKPRYHLFPGMPQLELQNYEFRDRIAPTRWSGVLKSAEMLLAYAAAVKSIKSAAYINDAQLQS